MNLKEMETQVLWGLIAELGNTLATRELIPPSERTGLYKDVSSAVQGILGALMQEINDRKPDSTNI